MAWEEADRYVSKLQHENLRDGWQSSATGKTVVRHPYTRVAVIRPTRLGFVANLSPSPVLGREGRGWIRIGVFEDQDDAMDAAEEAQLEFAEAEQMLLRQRVADRSE